MAHACPSVGIEYSSVRNIKEVLHVASSQKYDFVVVSIIRTQYGSELLNCYGTHQSRWPRIASRLKGVGESAEMSTALVACVKHVAGIDSSNRERRDKAKKLLMDELGIAQYFSVARVVIRVRNCNYWFVFPTRARQKPDGTSFDIDEGDEAELETWLWWNKIQKLCHYHGKVYPVLGEELSADVMSEKAQKRWLGEPVRAIILPTRIFLSNSRGYPILSQPHQQFILKMMKLKVQFVIKGINPNDSGTFELYQQYLKHITKQSEPTNRVLESFTHGYEDRLQIPLQPLADNLESRTYEIFEKDPIKYVQYEMVYATDYF
ncbi:unnamed protein product [Didymodactylos carnosus]|uniref:Uncharacterized protein n=1 Tax=Didymodactylos carnosus TaxID=1234261 RepID=A0A814CBU1_9BILA|nr:unnamed protein product [Didymodactylos carnosus]CAF1137303.1 unnamed protein product [Didymodactylos carnosus]CAF3714986.1 unnamed protein product [Didymodactylos carnosus]CAF3927480.1 unnamed protein product [Didymodactylos carnosus]